MSQSSTYSEADDIIDQINEGQDDELEHALLSGPAGKYK